jgi:regulator of protease activity HflC (stomatin/prohibitin superfamily)
MNGALEWIGQLIEWVGKFIPRWVIMDTTEGGVKFVCGKNAKGIGPGIHWYWPLVTTIVMYPTARQADNLRSQTMVTQDDRVIVVEGMIVYSVTDVLTLLSTSHSAATTIKDIALTAVHDVCCNMSLTELMSENRRGTLDTKLKNAAQKVLASYGVKVEKMMLIELAPCRVLKLIQTTSSQEG